MEDPVEEENDHRMNALQRHMEKLLVNEEIKCYDQVLKHPPPSDGLYCEALFDGWSCVNYTRAGKTAFVHCPPLPIFNTSELAHRHCTENGTWAINEKTGAAWTNHSLCVRNTQPPEQSAIDPSFSSIYLFIAGASLSLIFLTVSLAIFFGFRQLRCDRVVIHQNLFISFALTALTWMLYYILVIMDGDIIVANPAWCQFLHVLGQYFTTCSFSWMFCESVYLHMIMAHALRTGKKLIKCIIIAGWGAPIVLNVVYASCRAVSDVASRECWMNEDILQWIIAAPVLMSVALNIIILVNLVRLLVTKLKQIPDAHQNRKAAKAILILVPLFGLQFLLFPARPEKDTLLYIFYLHFMAFLMSTQGIWVSIIFCFCNGEVKSLLRRKWHQHRLMTGHARKNTGLTSSSFVDPYSVIDTSRDAIGQKSKAFSDIKTTDTQELRMLSTNTPTVLVSEDEEAVNERTKLQEH